MRLKIKVLINLKLMQVHFYRDYRTNYSPVEQDAKLTIHTIKMKAMKGKPTYIICMRLMGMTGYDLSKVINKVTI